MKWTILDKFGRIVAKIEHSLLLLYPTFVAVIVKRDSTIIK